MLKRDESIWRATHYHCPRGHDKPQPQRGPDGQLYCAACAVLHGILTPVVPCGPDNCGEGIAQIEFHTLSGISDQTYDKKGEQGGKYFGQGEEPVPSRMR